MGYKQKGWTPFTHNADGDDEHAREHQRNLKRINDKKKKKKKNGDVDPDAPGTPGKPGYEPPVKYDELDEKGKKLYKSLRRAKLKKK